MREVFRPRLRRQHVTLAMLLCTLIALPAAAIDWNISGLIRQEIAYSIAGNNNELNQMGNVFNDRITPHYTHSAWGTGSNAMAATSTFVNRAGVAGFFQQQAVAALPLAPTPGQTNLATVAAGANTLSPVNCRFAHLNAINAGSAGLDGAGGFRGVLCPNGAAQRSCRASRPGNTSPGTSLQGAALNDDINFNLFNTRAQLDVQARVAPNLAVFVKIRAYFDGTSSFTDGRIGNLFENPFWGTRSTIAEYATPDLPSTCQQPISTMTAARYGSASAIRASPGARPISFA